MLCTTDAFNTSEHDKNTERCHPNATPEVGILLIIRRTVVQYVAASNAAMQVIPNRCTVNSSVNAASLKGPKG